MSSCQDNGQEPTTPNQKFHELFLMINYKHDYGCIQIQMQKLDAYKVHSMDENLIN